jgi:uncharacterized membrane protein
VSFAAITLCVAAAWAFIVVVYFVIDSVRILLDTLSYTQIIVTCNVYCRSAESRVRDVVRINIAKFTLMMMMMMMHHHHHHHRREG